MVSPDTARTAVGIMGNVIALGLFLSPIPTFVRICRRGSVEEFSAFPYLATLLNCMMWVVYGLPVVHPHSTLVVTINGSGLAIELTYVVLFLLYSDCRKRARLALLLLAEVAFVAAVMWLVLAFAHSYDERSLVVGSLCVVFGTGMYVAPLSVMKMVIQSKSVEYMPFSISLASFFNGLCWTTYALIRFDLFITVVFLLPDPKQPRCGLGGGAADPLRRVPQVDAGDHRGEKEEGGGGGRRGADGGRRRRTGDGEASQRRPPHERAVTMSAGPGDPACTCRHALDKKRLIGIPSPSFLLLLSIYLRETGGECRRRRRSAIPPLRAMNRFEQFRPVNRSVLNRKALLDLPNA